MRIDGQYSGCAINPTLEAMVDRWSLIVIRDLMFGNRRHVRALLSRSEGRIASDILADRLKHLEKAGLVSRRDDFTHKQKDIYGLSEASIALVPLLAPMGGWGLRHASASKELSIGAKIREDGGPQLCSVFMDESRQEVRHVAIPEENEGGARPALVFKAREEFVS